MLSDELADPVEIRHDRAVEAPFAAQDRGQEFLGGDARDAVDVRVGVHDARHTRVPDGGLERQEELLADLARPEVCRSLVEPAFGRSVADHVLPGGDDPVAHVISGGALKPADVGAAHRGSEIRVFAECLLDPAPARIAGQVQDRREPLSQPQGQHALPNRGRDRLEQLRVPAGCGADRLSEARRRTGHQPVQRLLGQDSRDAPSRLLEQEPLDGVSGPRNVAGVQPGSSGQSRDVADPAGYSRPGGRHVDFHAVEHVRGPDGDYLRQLLPATHPRQEIGGSDLDRQSRIAIGEVGQPAGLLPRTDATTSPLWAGHRRD